MPKRKRGDKRAYVMGLGGGIRICRRATMRLRRDCWGGEERDGVSSMRRRGVPSRQGGFFRPSGAKLIFAGLSTGSATGPAGPVAPPVATDVGPSGDREWFCLSVLSSPARGTIVFE